MSKAKLFIENFFVYGLGGIISKIIPFIMVPVVIRLMPETVYFGLNDLVVTISSFATTFAVMGMYDAMYRLFFEKEDENYKKSVCSTALVFVCCMATIVSFVLVIFQETIGRLIFTDVQYAYLVNFSAIAVLVGAMNSIISAPTRMQNQRRIFLFFNTIGPILSYSVAILFLFEGYYIIALPLAAIVSMVMLNGSFYFLNHRWFSFHSFDFSLLKQLLAMGIPAMLGSLIYWIFNSCDRIMIAQFLDVGQEGVYAVGAKLGAVSQFIYTAFVGGWTYFVCSTMKEEKQVESNSVIHEYLAALSFLAGMWMCGMIRPLFSYLFPSDYFSGSVVAPYLFLAPLFLMLFQVANSQFYILKKTAPSALILLCGAFVNIILNYFLIPGLGIEGAAIATLLGYVVSDTISIAILFRMKLMIVSMRFIIIAGITIMYFVIWRFLLYQETFLSLALAFLISAWFSFLYRRELKIFLAYIKSFFNGIYS